MKEKEKDFQKKNKKTKLSNLANRTSTLQKKERKKEDPNQAIKKKLSFFRLCSNFFVFKEKAKFRQNSAPRNTNSHQKSFKVKNVLTKVSQN